MQYRSIARSGEGMILALLVALAFLLGGGAPAATPLPPAGTPLVVPADAQRKEISKFPGSPGEMSASRKYRFALNNYAIVGVGFNGFVAGQKEFPKSLPELLNSSVVPIKVHLYNPYTFKKIEEASSDTDFGNLKLTRDKAGRITGISMLVRDPDTRNIVVLNGFAVIDDFKASLGSTAGISEFLKCSLYFTVEVGGQPYNLCKSLDLTAPDTIGPMVNPDLTQAQVEEYNRQKKHPNEYYFTPEPKW